MDLLTKYNLLESITPDNMEGIFRSRYWLYLRAESDTEIIDGEEYGSDFSGELNRILLSMTKEDSEPKTEVASANKGGFEIDELRFLKDELKSIGHYFEKLKGEHRTSRTDIKLLEYQEEAYREFLEKKLADVSRMTSIIDGYRVLKIQKPYEGTLWESGIQEQVFLSYWTTGEKQSYLPILLHKQNSFLRLLYHLGLKPYRGRKDGITYKLLEQTFGLNNLKSKMRTLNDATRYQEIDRIFSENNLKQA